MIEGRARLDRSQESGIFAAASLKPEAKGLGANLLRFARRLPEASQTISSLRGTQPGQRLAISDARQVTPKI
jgi:hypothetical protein